MFFEGPKLKHAFSGSGGKRPPQEEPAGLLDPFKAAAVRRNGPIICQQLTEALKLLVDRHTNHGVAEDVKTHFTLKAITTRVENLRDSLQEGGASAYGKMKEAKTYIGRIHRHGLEA